MKVLVKYQNNPSNLSDKIILCKNGTIDNVINILSNTQEFFRPYIGEYKGLKKNQLMF